MSEYREMSGREEEDLDEIDLVELLHDIGQGIRKFWWFVVSMVLLSALLASVFVSFSYSPKYVASASMSVREIGNTNYNATQSAKRMEIAFPYILTSGVLKNVVAEDMGMEEMPGEVSVSTEEGANIFTIYAEAEDPQTAYDLLWSVIDNYPTVSEFVFGKIKMEILDESGIPTDSGKDAAVRDALIKGALVGLLIGLLPVGIYGLTRRTVKSKKELKKTLNLKELGSIPLIRMKKRKKELFLSTPSLMNDRVPQYYLEAMKKLTIRVIKEMEEKGYKSLLVSSSVSSEGKSTLAANLAISAAKNGKKVVLVDCDMRNPSIADAMNKSGIYPGLASVLLGKTKLEKALTQVSFPGGQIKVLFGGEPSNKNSKLLGMRVMKELIEELEKEADMVILDAAPSDLLVDSSMIAKFADAAMYVVRYDHVKMNQIQNGVEALSMSGVDIIGYVFNADESAQSGGYGYGYGYKYYGGYGRYGNYSRDKKTGGGSRALQVRNYPEES